MRPFSNAAVLLSLLAVTPASAADEVVPTVVSAPPTTSADCAGANALARIKQNFAWAEATQWHRGFVIGKIGNPRPSGHTYSEPGLVKRDYCVADSIMTNGSTSLVYYVVEHGQGFVGIGSDVDFCVPGLDPWHIHDGDCRTVR